MANVSPRKTPRREREKQYVGFNAEPQNIGTRTGKAMPENVKLLANGFEDPDEFLNASSSPRAETEMDIDSVRTVNARAGFISGRSSVASRRTVRTEITSRSVVGSVNGHGRKSLTGLAEENVRDDDEEEEEEMRGHVVDSLLDDTLSGKGKGKQTDNGQMSQSLEDMELSTIEDTPTKRRNGPHRPRPSASPASGSSRPILSQLAERGLDDIRLPVNGLNGDDSGNAFDDDDEDNDGDVAESPSVRAAKTGNAKRMNASKRIFTAKSKRLSKANGELSALSRRAPNGSNGIGSRPSDRDDTAAPQAGPSRRTGDSERDGEQRQDVQEEDAEAGGLDADDEAPAADDQVLDDENADGVDPGFGMDDFGDEQAGLDADPQQISSRRSSTRAAAAKSREKTAATAKGKGRKAQVSPERNSADEFDGVPEAEAVPIKAKTAAKKPAARPKPAAKAKKVTKANQTKALARETSAEPRPRSKSHAQIATAQLEQVDEAARTRGRLRSAAERHKPLRHWLGEKPVLKRSVITDTGDANNVVPEVQGWLIKQQPVQSLVNKRAGVKRKRAGSNSVPPRTANKRRAAGEEEEDEYAGWEDETEASAIVAQYSPGGSTEQEHVRRIACTKAMVRVKAIKNANFGYQKIFGEEEFFAAGVLHIPVKAEKASKNSRDNAYAFHVFKGCVKVSIHRHQFIIAEGGQFMIPRGNFYAIENVCDKTVEIFFSQARRLKQSEIEAADQKGAESQSEDGQGMDQDDGSGSEDANN
ncbi:Mif2/CENP-C like-domain-containing protein [Filobasidium floriforme]|uniref:Mif2/CENP-C like-domain-containing protein n=1 Tax=Filobasidium floriforme TaxID=5210 RepID=UPI001E8E19F4|nr:Mif2/CENP-C like-domain-containing protein [Filobasidium floriforme]KAH8090379.1 Mif2/CENP-C like-domain-containing protein [Filobasidium floriforme]